MKGTVKWFNATKGFGFIEGEDGEDYFVHQTAIKDDKNLRDDDKVTFDAVDAERGKQAQNVELDNESESSE
ncbi:MAG: cold-shock protein [uncultured DHVE6 group euryarchaeote]|jgi:CspA family cold shock protein|nr:MAG: cold-shock protein [uncultured DHVE6 group euryarchaeote]